MKTIKKSKLTLAASLGFLIFITASSCGNDNKTDATVEEVKNEMPKELKDSTILQEEEKSALDKMNSISDSSVKN